MREKLDFERAKEYRDQMFILKRSWKNKKLRSTILQTVMFLVMRLIKDGCVFKYFLSDKENLLKEMFPVSSIREPEEEILTFSRSILCKSKSF